MCALESLWIQLHRSCQATCSLILGEKPSAVFSNTAPFLVCHSMSGLVQKVSPHFMWLHYIFLEVKKWIFFAFLFFVCGLIFIPTVLLKYDFLNFYLQTNKKKTKQKPKQTHTTPQIITVLKVKRDCFTVGIFQLNDFLGLVPLHHHCFFNLWKIKRK